MASSATPRSDPPPTIAGLDALYRGFADPTRIRILNLLAAGELCVCDLVAVLQLPQPKVSRHLAYLRRSGLVECRRGSRFAYYRLAPSRHSVHQNLIHCVSACFRGIPSLDKERRAVLRRVVGCRPAASQSARVGVHR